MKNKYLIFSVLVVLASSIIVVQLVNQNEAPKEEKAGCTSGSCSSDLIPKTLIPKTENPSQRVFEETVGFSAVATGRGSDTKYFNWKPKNSCPAGEGCYLKNITALVTFLNAGDPLIPSENGAGYVQIASSKESNCQDPSQAGFTRYLAYSSVLKGGESRTKQTCGESTTPNTCNLTKEDGFDAKNDCFSLKIFAPSTDEGEINFATHLIFLTYTYETQ